MRTELLAVGMLGGGSRLGERIERLLAHRAIYSAHDRLFGGFLAAVLLAFACASSLAPPLDRLRTGSSPVVRYRLGQIEQDAATPSFVRVNRAGIDYSRVPLARIIAEAYQIPYTRITTSDSRLREVLSGTYDIRAKANTLRLGLLAAKASEEV